MSAAWKHCAGFAATTAGARLTLAQFKTLVREQFFMLLLDQEAALAAIPKLLPDNADERRAAFAAIREVLSASAEISGETAKRLAPGGRTVRRRCDGKPEAPRMSPLRSEGEGVVTLVEQIGSTTHERHARMIQAKRSPTPNMSA